MVTAATVATPNTTGVPTAGIKLQKFSGCGKVPKTKIKGTIWERPPGEGHDQLPVPDVDLDTIQALFDKAAKDRLKKVSHGALMISKKSKKVAKKSLISDPKRAQSIGIALANVKLPFAELLVAVKEMKWQMLDMDPEKAEDKIKFLQVCAPNEEEEPIFQAFLIEGKYEHVANRDELFEADQFLLDLTVLAGNLKDRASWPPAAVASPRSPAGRAAAVASRPSARARAGLWILLQTLTFDGGLRPLHLISKKTAVHTIVVMPRNARGPS